MSRDVGQISTRRAVAGLVCAAIIATAVVAGLGLLIDSQEVTLDAPAEVQERTCELLAEQMGEEPWRVTSSGLVECPRLFDGHRVLYEGEAVRAILRRGDRAWVHLNDDPYGLTIGPLPEHRTAVGGNSGIPVSIPWSVADQITHVGDSSHLGDVLTVQGIFQRADPADGGGPTIQANTSSISRTGRRIDHAASPTRVLVAVALIAGSVILAMLNWRRTN